MPAASSYAPRYQSNPLLICGVDSTMNTPLPTTGIAAQLAALFPAAQVINNCINGLSLTSAITNYPSTGGSQWNAAYARNISLFVGGANDIVTGSFTQDIIDRIASFWALNLATGYTPIVCTIIANGLFSAPQDSIRLDVNTAIRNTYPAAQVADWGANVHYALASDANPVTNPIYYSDVAHPTVFGAGVLAGIAQPLITNFLA